MIALEMFKPPMLDYSTPTASRWPRYLTWIPGAVWTVLDGLIILFQRRFPSVAPSIVITLACSGLAVAISVIVIAIRRRDIEGPERFFAICFAIALILFALITPPCFYRDD